MLENVALRCFWSNPDRETSQRLTAVAGAVPVAGDDPRLLKKDLDRGVIPVQVAHHGGVALVRRRQGWTGPLGPRSRRIDCMIANVVVLV